MGAPVNATYLVEDPNATLTAEKVTGTDLILTPFDYIIWASGGTVYAQNGKTGKIDSSGPDSAAVVQFAINQAGVGLVVLQEDIPTSSGTIAIRKDDVSLVCLKDNKLVSSTPYLGKLVIGRLAADVSPLRGVMVSGIQFNELQIDAPTPGNDVDGVLIENCQFNNFGSMDRMGIRFTGAGAVKNIRFKFCAVRAQAANTSLVSFENSSDSNGHIKFDRCLLDDIQGYTGVDAIAYFASGPGRTTGGLVFEACSFVFSGGTPTGCTIVHLKGTAANAGPAQLVLCDCHFDVQFADFDFLVVESNSNAFLCSVFANNPCFTVSAGKVYRWIWNKNPAQPDRFIFGSCLSVHRGRQSGTPNMVWSLGIPNQTPNFKVVIRDFIGLNPQGSAIVVLPPAAPFIYTNDDGVYESLYISGSVMSIVKNGITLFTSTPATVDLAPRESVTLNYVGTPPTVVKDRK